MNDILKQRLVGALVLIALGVLFWPVIFVETERPDIDRTPRVKPMPELAEVEIPPPARLPDVESVDLVEAMREQSADAEEAGAVDTAAADLETPDAGSDTVADSATTPASPELDEQGIPVAWVLQVASVSTVEKADKLTADLIAAGYKAYHRAFRRGDEVLYRVFVGPVFERGKLAEAKRDVDERLNVSAIIARYVP